MARALVEQADIFILTPAERRPQPGEARKSIVFSRQRRRHSSQARRRAIYHRWRVIAAEQLPLFISLFFDQLVALRSPLR